MLAGWELSVLKPRVVPGGTTAFEDSGLSTSCGGLEGVKVFPFCILFFSGESGGHCPFLFTRTLPKALSPKNNLPGNFFAHKFDLDRGSAFSASTIDFF